MSIESPVCWSHSQALTTLPQVILSPSPNKVGPVLKKIRAHPGFQSALEKYNPKMWIFDGNKLAWAPVQVGRGEIRVKVDLDEGRPEGKREGSQFYVTLRQTTEIEISALQSYLEQKSQFNTPVQEALNFLDHLLRQWPSEKFLAIRRNFYHPSDLSKPLLPGKNIVEIRKGLYASLRLSHNMGQGGVGISLNVDVANTCFWVGKQSIADILPIFLETMDSKMWGNVDHMRAQQALKPVQGSNGEWTSSDAFKQLRKLRRLKFRVKHPNRANNDKLYTVMDFSFSPKYGPNGGTARNVTFDLNGRPISVFDYFQEKYKVTLRWGNLPLISTGKNELFPMEVAYIEPYQRYPFKLNPEQTTAMIKFAVTRPPQRKNDIQRNASTFQIGSNPYLSFYGAQFEKEFARTEARILPPPAVNFSAGHPAEPKYTGRWDLRGKTFWQPNVAPLNAWGFICLDNCVQEPSLQQFASTFRKTFLGHGGKCAREALLINVPGNVSRNAAAAVAFAFEQIKKQRGYPQLLFIVVGHRNSPYYERIKKSADCRFGILSQVVNAAAVNNNNGQYHSNVCMKVNAKLGGSTSRTMPPWRIQPKGTYFPKDRPTVMIGVDVSHAPPGANDLASTAAMTMSVDPDATKYAAMVETNGFRVEMLTPPNIHFLFGNLINKWKAGHAGAFPSHIIIPRWRGRKPIFPGSWGRNCGNQALVSAKCCKDAHAQIHGRNRDQKASHSILSSPSEG